MGLVAARVLPPQAPLSRLRSAVFWSLLSLLPDVDVIGKQFGIRYHDALGHRGASHSLLACALLAASIGVLAHLSKRAQLWRTACMAAVVLVSHPLLDTLTDGGLGCALLWPFDATRYFAPWRPIPVAPLGRAFWTEQGLRVALAELAMFAPLFAIALWPRFTRVR